MDNDTKKIRVLIVDDSPLIREALKSILSADPDIDVVGLARDGREGVNKALTLRPDVITMDIKMPLMSGLEAIEEIMEEVPTPIIAVSSLDSKVVVSALGVGAMDFVAVQDDIESLAKELVEKVKIASRVRPMRRLHIPKMVRPSPYKKGAKEEADKVIAIGISTGGPQALQVLFSKIPHDIKAGILVVQHIAVGFIGGLIEWLISSSGLDIRLAKSGDIVKCGTVFFAPDSCHMTVDKNGRILLSEDAGKKSLFVPSIDVMMKSVAESYKEDAVGVIMTGMGSDGVEGIRAIKKAGGLTIAQDHESSAIFGMNKLAIESGFIDKIVPLERMAGEIMIIIDNRRSK